MKPWTALTKSEKQTSNIFKRGNKEVLSYLKEINSFIHVGQFKFKSLLSRKLKSFNAFRLVAYNNGVIKQFKRVNLESFTKRFGLECNPFSRIVGVTPDYVGVNPSKPIKSVNFIVKAMSKIWVNKKNLYSDTFNKQVAQSLIERRVVYTGGYDGGSLHLHNIFNGNKDLISDSEIFKILSLNRFNWFNIPFVDLDKPSDLPITTGIKLHTSPGHYFSKLIGRTKGAVLQYTLPLALQLLEKIRLLPTKNYALWQILGRAKDIKLPTDNKEEEASTRVILNTEAPVSFLLCNFAQKISAVISNDSYDNKFDIKEEFGMEKYHKYNSNNLKYDYYIDADWKNFDANVSSQFIRIAMSILLSDISCISEFNKRICFYIVNSLITKYIVVPPGVVVECNKGIPSGHPFTTLCNCFVNLIYWSIIGYKIYGDNYSDMMEITVYGDDAMVWFRYDDRLSEIDNIIESVGIKSDKIRDNFYPCKLYGYIDEQPDFLKRRFNDVEIKWNTKKMFDRFIYQTKNRGLLDQVDMVFSYLQTAPFDDDLFMFCKLLIKELDISEYDIYKYDKILSEIEGTKLRLVTTLDLGEKARVKEMSIISFSHCAFKERIETVTRYIKENKMFLAYFLGENRKLMNFNKTQTINAIKMLFRHNRTFANNELKIDVISNYRAGYVLGTCIPP